MFYYLDKTGTITLGNRQATEFIPAEGVSMKHWQMQHNLPRLQMKHLKGEALLF